MFLYLSFLMPVILLLVFGTSTSHHIFSLWNSSVPMLNGQTSSPVLRSPFFMFLVAKMAWSYIPLSYTIPHPSLCSLLQKWNGLVYLCHIQFLTLLYVPCCKDGTVWYTFIIYNSSPFLMFFVAKMACCGIPLSLTIPHPS